MFGLGIGKLGSVGRAIAAWSPAQLWPLGATSPGLWIDPPYTASMFQDSAGTTAISAIGTVLDTSNPVGLILDRKGGLALGPELVTNGDFSNGTTGWSGSASGTIEVLSGALRVSNVSGGYNRAFQNISAFSAGWLKISVALSGTAPLLTFLSSSGGGSGNTAVASCFYYHTGGTLALQAYCNTASTGVWSDFDNISVREIPGIHLFQATATSRPVASARVNLLTNTSRCDLLYPTVVNGTVTAQTGTAPDGSLMALFTESATSGEHLWYGATNNWITGNRYTFSTHIKPNGRTFVRLNASAFSALEVFFNLLTGETRINSGGGVDPVFAWEQLSNGIVRISASAVCSASGSSGAPFIQPATSLTTVNYAGDGVSGFYQWGAQLNLGSTALDYQRVTTASDYDASAGPTYTKLDGTDDGWLSATFTANTAFTAGMDALIAVRRDSTANAVCGLYQSVAEANKVFGIAESGSGSGCVGSGAGTPTVLVDGTQLTGGTAVTRDTLHTALTPGDWHILEFRNLDLSTWTAVGFGLYTGYVLNGGYGGHKVFSNGQDANRDKARAEMAAYFGVTLP